MGGIIEGGSGGRGGEVGSKLNSEQIARQYRMGSCFINLKTRFDSLLLCFTNQVLAFTQPDRKIYMCFNF